MKDEQPASAVSLPVPEAPALNVAVSEPPLCWNMTVSLVSHPLANNAHAPSGSAATALPACYCRNNPTIRPSPTSENTRRILMASDLITFPNEL
jgi:hypothetical protein